MKKILPHTITGTQNYFLIDEELSIHNTHIYIMSDWINIFWYIFEYQWYFHSFKLTVVSKHTQWMFIPHMPSEASVSQFWSGCQYTEGQPEPEGETGTGCVATGEEGSSSSPGPEIIRTTQCLVQSLTYLIYNIFISYFTASKLPAFQKYRYQFTMKCEYLIIYIMYCQDKTWLTAQKIEFEGLYINDISFENISICFLWFLIFWCRVLGGHFCWHSASLQARRHMSLKPWQHSI